MKPCFKCGIEKPLSQFYKHPRMSDGHVNKCKDCNKKDVTENRSKRIEQYREYDRERGNRQSLEDLRKYRAEYPGKYRAHTVLNNAIRKGLVVSEPCEQCERIDTHGHHDDYAKPLKVRWLCPPCHKAWHLENGEAPNGQ